MRTESLGGLRVHLAGGDDREGRGGPVVVLMHGFGAPGDDLASLARIIDAPRGTRFVFPEAPHSVPGFGDARAWWMIDMARLERLAQTADLTREVPQGLAEARARAIEMLDAVEQRLAPSKLVLGGFSQGAMLACDVALRTERPLAALVMMSGTSIAADEWTPLMPRRSELAAFISHGSADRLLPFALSEQLRDALVGAGWNVAWVPFRGGHEIPPAVVDQLGGFLRRTLGA